MAPMAPMAPMPATPPIPLLPPLESRKATTSRTAPNKRPQIATKIVVPKLVPLRRLTTAKGSVNDGSYESLAATPSALRASEARLSSCERTVAGNRYVEADPELSGVIHPRPSASTLQCAPSARSAHRPSRPGAPEGYENSVGGVSASWASAAAGRSAPRRPRSQRSLPSGRRSSTCGTSSGRIASLRLSAIPGYASISGRTRCTLC